MPRLRALAAALAVLALAPAAAHAAVAPEADRVEVQPGAVEVDLVRGCPFGSHLLCGSGHETTRVWVTPAALAARSVRVLGGGDAGQSAVAELRPAGGDDDGTGPPPSGYAAAEVHATATAHGDYQATLTLDPGAEKPTRLTVAVRARVWVGWAILVVLIGVACGALTHALYDARRARALLLARLGLLLKDYEAALPADPGMPVPEPLFETLAVPDPPDADACLAADRSAFVDLHCRVRSARSDQQAAGLEPEVVAAEGVMRRWIAVDRALGELREAYDDAGLADAGADDDAPPDPFAADVDDVLDGVTVPDTAEQAGALAAALRAHAVVLPLYATVRARSAARARQVYRARFKADDDLGARALGEVKALETGLREALEEMGAPPAPKTRALMHIASAADISYTLSADGPAAPARRWPSVAELLARFRALDRVVYAATLVIAAAVYVVTVYDDKPWGSLADLVTAFGAGFAGAGLAGVATLPAVRATVGRVVPGRA